MQAYETAVRHHRSGRLPEAEELYRAALAERPELDQAWFLLSVLAMGRGDEKAALLQLTRAVELAPDNPTYHSNLGLLLRKLGRSEEAATTLLRALSLNPDSIEASYNLGLVMRDQGNLAAAQLCFERVTELQPGLAMAQNQLAQVLLAKGEIRRAVGHYQASLAVDRRAEAIALELTQVLGRLGRHGAAESLLAAVVGTDMLSTAPNVPPNVRDRLQRGQLLREQGQLQQARAELIELVTAQPRWLDPIIELGSLLGELSDLDAALLCYEQATDLDACNAMAQYRLASLLVTRGELEIAIGHYQCALVLEPNSVEFIAGLATVYQALERSSTETLYRRALTIQPGSAKLHTELGTVLSNQGQHDEAMVCFDRAMELEPDLSSAWVGRALALFDSGRVEDAIAANQRALGLGPNPEIYGRHLYMMMYDPAASAREIHESAQLYARGYATALLPKDHYFGNTKQPERRLRIGFVSPDFRNHCQSFYMVPLLKLHDPEQFEVTCYSTTRLPDSVTERLREYADVWRDVSAVSDVDLARIVREDEIDILIDVTMHMQGSRLLVFARKPAPIQIAWLAYPGTTGLSTIDYRITDPYIDPPEGVDEPYVEQSIRLPDAFWCYDPLRKEPAVGALPALQTGHITFGCLNSFSKINSPTLELWAGVLRAVAGSRLILLAPGGSARERTVSEFERLGIDAARVEFVNRRPRAQYLELYHRIDACLDSVPYNGHTTSFDATWMGVPVLTLLGNTAVGRAGACLAQNLGMPELIALDAAEYVQRAVELCSDIAQLAQLRATLRARFERSPLMDAPRFTRNFEAVLRDVWRVYCRQ